ncbi:MAG TPA: hypothetical protein VF804_05675 [Holophagaceae bacterium]
MGAPLRRLPRSLLRDPPGREVRGYHKELPQRLDGDLLVAELLAAAE